MKRADRKTKIEQVLKQFKNIDYGGVEPINVCKRLEIELETMCEPEARPPRFNRLLRAIWVAATNEQS